MRRRRRRQQQKLQQRLSPRQKRIWNSNAPAGVYGSGGGSTNTNGRYSAISSSSSDADSDNENDMEEESGAESERYRGTAGSTTTTPRKLLSSFTIDTKYREVNLRKIGDTTDTSGNGSVSSAGNAEGDLSDEDHERRSLTRVERVGMAPERALSFGEFLCDSAADVLKAAAYAFVLESYILRKRGNGKRALGQHALAIGMAVAAYRGVRRASQAALCSSSRENPSGRLFSPDSAASIASGIVFALMAPSGLADAAVAHAAVHCVRSLWSSNASVTAATRSIDMSALILVLLTPVLQMEWLWLPNFFPGPYKRVLDKYSCWEEVLIPARKMIRTRDGPPVDLSALVPAGVVSHRDHVWWHLKLLPRQFGRAFTIYLPLQLFASAAQIVKGRLSLGDDSEKNREGDENEERRGGQGKEQSSSAYLRRSLSPSALADTLISVSRSSLFMSLAYWVPISLTTAICGLRLHRTSIISRPFRGHLKIMPWIILSGCLGTFSGLIIAERRSNRRKLLASYLAAWTLEVAKNALLRPRGAARLTNLLTFPLLCFILFGVHPDKQAQWLVALLRGR